MMSLSKIAIIMPLSEKRGGGEKRLVDLISKGQQRGIEWLLIFLSEGPLVEQVRSLGVSTWVVPSGRLREIPQFVIAVTQIAEILRSEKVDAVLSWMWKAHLYGLPSAKLVGLPAIWSQLEVPDDSWIKRLVTRLPASGMLINSQASKDKLEQLCPGRPIRLVYPGVDLEAFDHSRLPTKSEAREQLGLSIDRPLIGIVSRLQRWKGIHVLVEAMPRILERYPDAHCAIVGGTHHLEPDYEKELKLQIQSLGLEDRITLHGLQSNIPLWMQAMDVVVHASKNEPFGIVIVEAMALGKPVVATIPGGPLEIITDGKNGLLVPYGNIDLLSNAILNYLNSPEFMLKIGVAAQNRANDFSTQCFANNFVDAVRDLLANYNGAIS